MPWSILREPIGLLNTLSHFSNQENLHRRHYCPHKRSPHNCSQCKPHKHLISSIVPERNRKSPKAVIATPRDRSPCNAMLRWHNSDLDWYPRHSVCPPQPCQPPLSPCERPCLPHWLLTVTRIVRYVFTRYFKVQLKLWLTQMLHFMCLDHESPR